MTDPTINHACGECCWFIHEMLNGGGLCVRRYCEDDQRMRDDFACEEFTGRQQMRHHLATLIRHDLWRRYNSVTNSRRQDDPKETGEAIDFAIDYIKQFSKF